MSLFLISIVGVYFCIYRFGNPTSQRVFNGLGGYTYLGQLLSHEMNKDGKFVLHRNSLSTSNLLNEGDR